MHTRLIPRTGFAILAVCSAVEWARGDYAVLDPKDVEMRVELVSPPPLVLQPARLRVSIRNVSKKRLGPIGPLDNIGGVQVKSPRDNNYGERVYYRSFRGTTTPSVRSTMNARAPLYLEPDEQTSVSFALGVWGRETWGGRDVGGPDRPLFPEPGEYWLKCWYTVDAKQEKRIEKEIKVEVREPRGEDRAVYEVLQRNPPLTAALLDYFRPPDEKLVPKLKAIVELFPGTSYTDYARFGLARFYLKGNGFPLTLDEFPNNVGRVDLAKATDQLEWIYSSRHASAYYPNAMIAMRVADLRFYETNKIAARLLDKYGDSVECLELFAMILMSPTPQDRKLVEWAARREYPAVKDPIEQQRATTRFRNEVWTTWRKRIPSATEQKGPKP